MRKIGVFIVLILLTLPVSAFSGGPDAKPLISEIRGGLYAHDIDLLSFHREGGSDINGEILFSSPEVFDVIWSPRPHIGATVNMSGNTSHVYGGLTWDLDLPAGFFVEANLGGAVHDGYLDTDKGTRKSLGSRVLFRFGGALGYNLTEHWNVSVQMEHISNAYLADPNEGMDNLGVRLGYRF